MPVPAAAVMIAFSGIAVGRLLLGSTTGLGGDLLLLTVDLTHFGDDLIWEPSRGGALWFTVRDNGVDAWSPWRPVRVWGGRSGPHGG